jgi:hypothetical protein
VRERARKNKQERFTALPHHVTPALLRDSFFALKRKAAPGVEGVTWQEYATGLEDRLKDLHGRVHRGVYRAQASKRRWIPKDNRKQRSLGIAALEDKIVQQVVLTVPNEIYEEDFRGVSYGGLCGGWLVTAIPTATVFHPMDRLQEPISPETVTVDSYSCHRPVDGFAPSRVACQIS